MSEPTNQRKSTISVGIKRLLNTAQYENVEIKLETTDEITWSTPAERSAKIDKLQSALNTQYLQTQKAVLAELGVQEKKAWFKSSPAAALVGDAL